MSRQIPTGEFTSKDQTFLQQCESVEQQFAASDDVVQAGRNTLKKIRFNDDICVAKCFFIPRFPQNYSYGTFSKSKAKKSYENGQRLIELGFRSPRPVGYFEYRSRCKLRESYYICKFADGTQTLQAMLDSEEPLSAAFIQQFAVYCHSLHLHGIEHRDFNPKNILVSNEGGSFVFSLVDINRITWSKPLSLKKSLSSLSRIPLPEATHTLMLQHYAELAGSSLEECQSLLRKAEEKTQRYFRNKKRFRKIFPKKR